MAAKRRMILNGLLKNSSAAYFAAIEIHNKPNIEYRYETTTVLLLNAWELLLKAYVRKFTKRGIFTADNRTIKFKTALEYSYGEMSDADKAWFEVPRRNLELLEQYRNRYSHFYDTDLNALVFSMLAKASITYVEFYKRFFNGKLLNGKNLYILPLGFDLPFEPEAFLGTNVLRSEASNEVKEYLAHIVSVTEDLQERGISDSVFVSFDVKFGNARAVKNADFLAQINKDGGIPFHKQTTVKISNDKGAAPVYLSDGQFFEFYSMTHDEFVGKCEEKISDFKRGKKFNGLKKTIQNDSKYAKQKSANRDGSGGRYYYSEDAVSKMVELWNAPHD